MFAIFKPASVFPAPGTPVIKQIDFLLFLFEKSIISEIQFDVTDKFSAPESLLEISETLCFLYRAVAASIIVGVGL